MPWPLTAVMWSAPDWQPHEVPTPESFDGFWIQSASADGRVFGSCTPMADVYIWWDGPDALPTVYAEDGQYYWFTRLSADGKSAIGKANDELGFFRAIVYTRDGITFLPLPRDRGESGVACISSDGSAIAGGYTYTTTEDDGTTVWHSEPLVWIDRHPEVLPRPEGYSTIEPRSIDNGGTRVSGLAMNTKPNGERLPAVSVEWKRLAPGVWDVALLPDQLDEAWGVMRADGRRRFGMLPTMDVPVFRDVFHGDRAFRSVVEGLFPELPKDSVFPVSAALGDGRIVVSGDVSWIITLPALADVNEDGLLDAADMMLFVDALVDGSPRADWNLDGQLTFEDFDAFVADFESGTR